MRNRRLGQTREADRVTPGASRPLNRTSFLCDPHRANSHTVPAVPRRFGGLFSLCLLGAALEKSGSNTALMLDLLNSAFSIRRLCQMLR